MAEVARQTKEFQDQGFNQGSGLVGMGTGGVCVLQQQRDKRSLSFSNSNTHSLTLVEIVVGRRVSLPNFNIFLKITIFVQRSRFTVNCLVRPPSHVKLSIPYHPIDHPEAIEVKRKSSTFSSKLDNLLVNK